MNEKHLYSSHIFLFPFRWNYCNKAKEIQSYADRTNINKFTTLLNQEFWMPFLAKKKEQPTRMYNDITFFYDFVRPSIFDLEIGVVGSKEMSLVKNYEFNFFKEKDQVIYSIETKKYGTYELNISEVRLNVYKTGVGVLSFHLDNYKYEDKEDVQRINDFGRRFFPQYLKTNKANKNSPPNDVLPLSVKIISKTHKSKILIDLVDYTSVLEKINNNNFNKLPNASTNLISFFLGENFCLSAFEVEGAEQIIIKPTLDDRLFGICWYGNNVQSRRIKFDKNLDKYGFEYYNSANYWLRFLFMEHGGSSCQSRLLFQDLIYKHTYHRWANYGTLYGVTPSTLVCLSDASDYVKENLNLPNHVGGQYFELVQLSLAQLASTQRFSEEVTTIRKKYDLNIPFYEYLNEAKIFEEHYLGFMDQLYFQSVTPLEQGGELYKLIQENLDIEKRIKKLELEMEEFGQVVNRREQQNREKMNNRISFLTMFFFPATILLAVFGMNTIDDDFTLKLSWTKDFHDRFWCSLVVVALLTAMFIIFRKQIFKLIDSNSKKQS